MGQAKKSGGYATFALSKWHLAGNVKHGGEWHELTLTIDPKDKLFAIHLDPCSARGEVRIKALCLQTSSAESRQTWPAIAR